MFTQVFTTQTSDANSSTVAFNGGQLEIVVSGTFGGGTVTLEANYPDVNAWVAVADGSWTESEVKLLELIRPCSLRLVLAGSSGASLDAWI